jgi:hypothetical protein
MFNIIPFVPIHHTGVLASAAADVGAARPGLAGLLLVVATFTCAALMSSAARLFGHLVGLLKDLLRMVLLALVAALVVLAVAAMAINDLLTTR